MVNRIFTKLRDLICHMGLSVTKCVTMNRLIETERRYEQLSSNIDFLKYLKQDKLPDSLAAIRDVKSQIQQDLFVLLANGFKKNGYFVDFGGTDGVSINNSWILENKYGWDGIVAEPSKQWHRELSKNRKCHISTKCVWKESAQSIVFNETEEAGFSTINTFSSSDRHAEARTNGTQYEVETITLNDLLDTYNAPKVIDYLSIDTEGSEYEILSAFDFDRWDISVITVEHNHTAKREEIKMLLESKGFKRVLMSISQFDDWYVKPKIVDVLKDAFLLEVEEIM